jgi:hypothetical protein
MKVVVVKARICSSNSTMGDSQMKIIILLIMFTITGIASAQDVHFSKQELIGIIGPATAEEACSQEFMACLDLSQATCNSEIDKLARGACSKHVPKGGAGVDEIADISRNLAKCVVTDIMARYKQNLVKNAKTPACQALTQ